MGLFIVNIHGDIEGDYEIIKQIPSAENKEELTNEKAIAFLQDNGWLVEHDRIMTSGIENKREWIPVSERLPDNNVRVLCSAISTSISGGYTRFVGCCDNGDWFVQTDAETVSYPRQYKVTAWMPLPEAYKETERGE